MRPAWLGLCVIGAALTSGYLVVFVFFALGAAALVRAPDFRGRDGARLLLRLGAVAAVTVVVLLVVLRPYLQAGYRRPPVAETTEIAMALSSYLASAATVHYRTWSGGYYHQAPDTLFPVSWRSCWPASPSVGGAAARRAELAGCFSRPPASLSSCRWARSRRSIPGRTRRSRRCKVSARFFASES